MLTIKHVDGPLAGQEQTISDDQAQVNVGRDPDRCQIVYPPDSTIVGRVHCGLLRQPSGDWAVDLYGDHYVEIDGVAAEPRQTIRSGAKIRLGRHNGPSFIANITHAASDDLGMTGAQQKQVSVRRVIRRDVRVAIGLVALAVFAAVGTLIYNARLSQQIRQRLDRAAFLVEIRHQAGGCPDWDATAWPVSRDLLVTNAHVVDEAGAGTMLVRAPGADGKEYEVIGHILHPGYKAFADFFRRQDLVKWDDGQLETPPTGLAYDVALLRVKGPLPEDAILPLASRHEAQSLWKGMQIESEGYPSQNISGSAILGCGATPKWRAGAIESLTDYFSSAQQNPLETLLVTHNIPITCGASGSPIIGEDGKVVAVISAFSSTGGECTPSAVQINYAQRADLVADLLDGRAGDALARDRQYWTSQLALLREAGYQEGDAIYLSLILQADKTNAGIDVAAKPALDVRAPMTLAADAKSGGATGSTPLKLAGGANYVIIAYAEDETPIALTLRDASGAAVAFTKPLSAESVWYPSLTYTPKRDGEYQAIISGARAGTQYMLRLYRWAPPKP
ncbi:MAG: trypsin-like peptidase domain-containing protein [Methylovirgula sp.]|uniref:trypsin-like peptidase domain-containing protein n=1 Tax=Methylovirgula sp. TaxID=1978224 RepID=UPI00307612FB